MHKITMASVCCGLNYAWSQWVPHKMDINSGIRKGLQTVMKKSFYREFSNTDKDEEFGVSQSFRPKSETRWRRLWLMITSAYCGWVIDALTYWREACNTTSNWQTGSRRLCTLLSKIGNHLQINSSLVGQAGVMGTDLDFAVCCADKLN